MKRAWWVQVLGEDGQIGGGTEHREGLALAYIQLTCDEAEGILDKLRLLLAALGGGRGTNVVDICRKGDAMLVEHAQGDVKNDDEKKTGEGAPLFHSVCRAKNLLFGPPEKSGTPFHYQGDYAQ